MPRSSRHKSSKHSSRDARDYSDSEKDSSLKERKGKEESSSRVSKDSDKRKLDSKDSHPVEYVSSKRRKERAVEDGVSDRWNGGEEDRGEVSRKSKSSSDSKSKRKEESEGKHKESSRKDRESDKERKGKEGKSEKLVVNEEEPNIKQLREITESNTVLAEADSQVERRIRRKKDDSADGDKHLDDVGDAKDRRFSSKDDISKDVKLKDEKRKDERYRDKYREDPNGDSKYQDERPTKDHTSSKSDEKYLRDDKDMTENRQKKSKSQDRDRDREHKTVRDRDQVRDRYHDHERESERDRERGRDRNHNRDRDYYRDHDWDKDRDRERGRERNWDRDRETDRERERDYDHDDRSVRYKDSRGREKSPDDRDDYNDSKPRVTKGNFSDMEKKPLSSSRVEFEADRGRSQSRQVPVDSSSKRRRISPSSGSHVGTDENRYFKSEESKYRDSATEQRSKAISSREVADPSRVPERSSKYRSMDKTNDVDDGHLGELSIERSSSSKASPMGLVERSPSSTSVERRQMNRSGLRRGHDAEEPGRRSGGGSFEDRLNRDTPLEKPVGDDPSQADSSFYNRTGQGNSSIPPLPGFRAGADSPSYMEDENKYSSNARYNKRSGDPNIARGHGNAWRGAPNWSSPMPNGFMPFQHGPPLGGFQSMMPQFPTPPLFGVRPSMEINHAGMPYHIPGADRFSGHLRPLGWQNMMDGSVPSHLHGWDGSNGVYRDEPHMYGGPDWDQNRHPMNRRNWETSTETWKGQNGDVNKDPLSTSQKEDYPVHGMDDEFLADGQVGQKSQQKRNHAGVHAKDVETSPGVKISPSQPKVVKEKMPDPSEKLSYNDAAQLSRAYLSKLDVSRDLANHELYIQCMRLLDLEDEEAAAVEDITMRVNLLGGRASLKTSHTFHGSSPLPASKDAVFQRAMDLYKKQHMDSRGVPIVTRAVPDEVAATDPEIKDDHIPNQNEGKEDEQMLTSNVELEPTSDKLIAEVGANQYEGKEDMQVPTDALVSASDQEMAEVVPMPAIKEEPELEPEPEPEPLPIPSFEYKNAVKSEADDMDSSPARDVKINGGERSGDGVNGNLSCSDGSVTVKAESNDDSESVVISRIH